MCAVTLTDDYTMLKQFSLNVMAVTIKTAVQEFNITMVWSVSHLWTEAQKLCLCFHLGIA